MLKLNLVGTQMVQMREELDKVAGNKMLTEALKDYVQKTLNQSESQLVLSARTAKELEQKLEKLPDYKVGEEDVFHARCDKISDLIVKYANPQKKNHWEKDKKQYKLRYNLTGDFDSKSFLLTRKFGLGETFLHAYFGVRLKKDYKRLMEAGGFLQEYVTFRIPFVLNKILTGVHEANKKGLDIEISPSYYSKSVDMYNVDLHIKFSADKSNEEVAKQLSIILCAIEDRYSISE